MRKFILISFITLVLILSGCSDEASSQVGPFPATDIVSEEPIVIGYIVEVLEEEQVIFVKSGVTKEEALQLDRHDTGLDMHSFFSNGTTFDGELEAGYKVAVWLFEGEEAEANSISEKIVVLEK